jgi:hypothetical protein
VRSRKIYFRFLSNSGGVTRSKGVKEDYRSQRRNKLVFAVHLIWATRERRPLITPDVERMVYHAISAEATHMGCEVLALGGMPITYT